MKGFRVQESGQFKNICQRSPADLDPLLNFVGTRIKKKDNIFLGEAVTAE
jgi:hypothetical protein